MTLQSIKTTAKNIKPTKATVLVIAGIIAILAITAVGIVHNARTERIEALQAAVTEQKQKDTIEENNRLKSEVSKLAAANQFQTAKADSVCDWVRSTQPRYRYTVPPLCVKQ